jgi:hypothetical protein
MAHQPQPKGLALVPAPLATDPATVRRLEANTAGYIDYGIVDDFLKLAPFCSFAYDDRH